MSLDRRTPLTVDPAKVRAWQDRSRRALPRESAKRRAERPARTAVIAETLDRAGHRCQAAELVPHVECWGRLDTHEVESRGTHPGSHLDPSVTLAVCRGHHEWIGAEPKLAEAAGLRRRATTTNEGDQA